MNHKEMLDKKIIYITEMLYGSTKDPNNERAYYYSLGMLEVLSPILLEMFEALNNWILFEKEQIKKEGPYHGKKLPKLIMEAENALKKFEEFLK